MKAAFLALALVELAILIWGNFVIGLVMILVTGIAYQRNGQSTRRPRGRR